MRWKTEKWAVKNGYDYSGYYLGVLPCYASFNDNVLDVEIKWEPLWKLVPLVEFLLENYIGQYGFEVKIKKIL